MLNSRYRIFTVNRLHYLLLQRQFPFIIWMQTTEFISYHLMIRIFYTNHWVLSEFITESKHLTFLSFVNSTRKLSPFIM